MLIKDIKKTCNFDRFISQKNYWLKLHKKNAKTPLSNIENPLTLGDKMTWCCCNCFYNKKLFNKATAKDEVVKILGTDEYIIPTYQICNNVSEINWENLIGKSFVIKPTCEACANGVVIQKRTMRKKDITRLQEQVKNNFYLNKSSNKIIIEKFIGSKNSKFDFQIDIKFWCFNGQPYMCELQQNGKGDMHCSQFRDLNFKKIDLYKDYYKHMTYKVRKPKNFDKMVEIATKLSQGMPVVRIDLYNINGKIYFGEFQKIYGYHCRFENVLKNKELSSVLQFNPQIGSSTYNERSFEIANSANTKEAKQILNCNDDNFEFIFSKNKFPIYFNNENKNFGIFKLNGFWFSREYTDGFKIKPNTDKKIYNKRTASFEPLREKEAKKILDIINDVAYCYDDEGDIVYFSPIQPEICVKYINGEYEKNEYDTVKVKKAKTI